MTEKIQIPMKPRVTAVVGAKAAGKDELAQYLVKQYGVLAIEVGAFARKLEKEIDEEEPHIQYDPSAKKLAPFGAEYVMSRLIAEITENESLQTDALVITGVRTPAEATALKARFGSKLQLVYVKVGDQKIRYERAKERDFATDPNGFQEFVQKDERLKSDHALAKTAALADITLLNNDTLDSYYQQIESHIVPHLFPNNINESSGGEI